MSELVYFVRRTFKHKSVHEETYEKQVWLRFEPFKGDKLRFNYSEGIVDHRIITVDRRFIIIVLEPFTQHYNAAPETHMNYISNKYRKDGWVRVDPKTEPKFDEAKPS